MAYPASMFKLLFVALCCAIAAESSWSAIHAMWCMESDRQISQAKGVAGAVLLFAVLLIALRLSNRGRVSASWAVLAYGSWMTFQVVEFLSVFRYISGSYPGWIMLVAINLWGWGGMRAALRDKWGAMVVWWLWSTIVALVWILR